MELIFPILSNTAVVVALYLIDKYTRFKDVPCRTKQVVFGLILGMMSMISSEWGIDIGGAVVNVRDTAPLSAGLIFGGPAGVIAGVIGGLYRWFSVFWGAGEYTRLACTISTIFAGVIAGILRKYMFDNKKPTWIYGVGIAVVFEVIHMLMIFLTNLNDPSTAFYFVQQAALPMIIGNAASLGVMLMAISVISRESGGRKRGRKEQISQTFQRWLLLFILIGFLFTSAFTFQMQNMMAKNNTASSINVTVSDVYQDIADASDENLLVITAKVNAEYSPGADLDTLARKYGVSEINIVDENGIIVESNTENFIGYDMADGEQSAAFLCLLEGERSFVQKYGPMSLYPDTYRKYAGVVLPEGGFLQVGYDSDQFKDALDEHVLDASVNRRIGEDGFVVICNDKMQIVASNKDHSGMDFGHLGLDLDPEKYKANILYEADIMETPCFFTYTWVEGYYLIGIVPQKESLRSRDVSIYVSLMMEVILFASLFILIYFLIKEVIINNLHKVNKSLSQITNGNLDVVVNVRDNEEFASLSDDINSTVSTLKRYIAEAAARIDKELEYAKQIQLSALPMEIPEEKRRERFDIMAQMIAAKEVGGDFYDFYMLDDDHVAFLCADVSGKGIPAAMFMMTAKTLLKDLAERRIPVNEIFTQANDKLCDGNESGMFVTAWMGVMDLNTGLLQYVNAGHNPPLIKQNGSFQYLSVRPGFVLAGMEGIRYRMGEIVLNPGDRLFLYTDGVTEATDKNNELYGEERLLSYMECHKDESKTNLFAGLKEDIDAFAGDTPQFDDITMLLFDYGQERKNADVMIEKVFPADDAFLNDVLLFAESELEKADCPMNTLMAISVVLEEVFVNIAHYAYGGENGDVRIVMSFDPSAREVSFRVSDRGIPFDPLTKDDPDITLSSEDRNIGGLGIYITKKTMDQVFYRYENGENILTIIKKI